MAKKKYSHMGRERLLQERADLHEELAHLRDSIRMAVDTDPDEGDADISVRERDVVLIEMLEQTLRDVDKALQAMERGQYGICERCHNPIPPERLEARPDATFCVQCQAEAERLGLRRRYKKRPIHSPRDQDSWTSEIQ